MSLENKNYWSLVALLALSACGGGGGGSTTTPVGPQPPVVVVPAPPVTPTPPVVTANYSFPAGLNYGNGILPSTHTREQMNQDLTTMWQAWRTAYLENDDTDPTLKRVMSENGTTSLSEGIGYGMLISAYMANTTNTGKDDFDAIFRFYKKYEKVVGSLNYGVMAWRIGKAGNVIDNFSAPDGDLDAAYALLVADKKWGSAGAIDYKAEAVYFINNLMKWSVLNRSTNASQLIARSDFTLTTQEGSATYSMSSYQMVGYFNQFRQATGDVRWDATLKAGYKAYDYFYNANPATGLTPFTFLTQPGSNQYLKASRGYNFGFDACRTPWRVGVDFLWHGNANSQLTHASDSTVNATLARDMPHRNTQWLKTVSGDNPMNVYSSYELNGTLSSGAYRGSQRNMVSPMVVAAMVDASNQDWLNTLYGWMRQQTPGVSYSNGGLTANTSYYEDTVMMVNMLIVTGNMPNLPEQ